MKLVTPSGKPTMSTGSNGFERVFPPLKDDPNGALLKKVFMKGKEILGQSFFNSIKNTNSRQSLPNQNTLPPLIS